LISFIGFIVLIGTLIELYEMYLKQILNNYSQNMKSAGILNPIINDEETEKLVQVKEIKSIYFNNLIQFYLFIL
jgi:hypothetical protein